MYSSTFESSLWSTVNVDTTSWESSTHRESPTDATVMVHPSTTTIVTVVPDVCSGEEKKKLLGMSVIHKKQAVKPYKSQT